MNTYALPGFKVKITKDSLLLGNSWDNLQAEQFLHMGMEYTVQRTLRGKNKWKVELAEIPERLFSADIFIDISSQDEEKDKQHPDYIQPAFKSLISNP